MWRATFLFFRAFVPSCLRAFAPSRLCLCVLFLCLSFTGYAQPDSLFHTNQNPDVSVIVRHPDQKSIDKFNNDDNFQYEEKYTPDFFDRLMTWAKRKLFGNIKLGDNSFFFIRDYIVIPVAILLIIFAIIKLSKIKVTGIFGRKPKNTDLTYLIDDENVKGSEFDELMAKALDDKNYRLAVRYLYLKTLQQLDRLQLIAWNPNKTNRSYVDELTDKSLVPSFREKIFLFELIWYGEYQIKESDFAQIQHTFAMFNQKMQQAANV